MRIILLILLKMIIRIIVLCLSIDSFFALELNVLTLFTGSMVSIVAFTANGKKRKNPLLINLVLPPPLLEEN